MGFEVEIAQDAGACYGVMRALKMANEAALQEGRKHTLGPLIHNPRVVDKLAASGVGVANSLEEAREGTLILRSHGTAPQIVQEAHDCGFNVVDATCPYVSKVQRRARELGEEGYGVVIIGEPGHAEVEGIRAWGGEAVVAVADTPEKLPCELPVKLGVVIQTTQSEEHVNAVLDCLRSRVSELRVEKTVCFATQKRQQSCAELASRADAMIVVGGRNSGNTTRLFEIAQSKCANSHHIEAAEEIDSAWLERVALVGITAGASTPAEHIESVRARLVELGGLG